MHAGPAAGWLAGRRPRPQTRRCSPAHLPLCLQVPAVVRMALAAVAEGKCAVIGLQSTGEARTADVVAERGEAEERGHERGRAEAAAEFDEERAAAAAVQEQQLEEHLQTARQQWVDSEGAVLADRLDRAMSELRETVALHTANILQALVEPAVKERMLGEVVQAIETLTRQDATMLLRVEGPADLLESVRKSLAGRVRSLDLVESETPDVKVIAQDSLIESQLGAWLEGLKEGGDA